MVLTLLIILLIAVELAQDTNCHFYTSVFDILKPIGLIFVSEQLNFFTFQVAVWACYIILGTLGVCAYLG